MTVERQNVTSGPYFGNGVTTSFPITFHAASADEVGVYVDDLDADRSLFTVALSPDGTGSVVFAVAPIGAVMPYSAPLFSQEVRFEDQGPFYQSSVNDPLDRAAIRDLVLLDMVARAPQLPREAVGLAGLFAQVQPDGSWGLTPSGPGATGTSNNTRLTLAELKAAAVTDKTSLYGGSLWTWTPGNFSGRSDDVNIVASNAVSLAVGAWLRQASETVYLRNLPGCDPTGATSSVAAFNLALSVGRRVLGAPGDIYLLDTSVVVPSDREIVGNGATLKIGPSIIGALNLANDRCSVDGWTIQGSGGGYAVLNTGKFNQFVNNVCRGNIGHFFFSTNAEYVYASGNRVEGLTASTEITAAIALEYVRTALIESNLFWDIPEGWGVHARERGAGELSEDITVSNNKFRQTQYSDTKTATAGQRTFTFTLAQKVLTGKAKVQVNGKPLSKGYTVSNVGNNFTVNFDADKARAAGEVVKLVGYRGAENIQINGGTHHYVVNGNTVNGTGDSGIIALGPYGVISGNNVRNCGYAGIAVYGDINYMVIADNIIADCAQMDDGLSSPDIPEVASVFAGGIFLGGEGAIVSGNLLINDSGTMTYGIFSNKVATLRTDGSSSLTLHDNSFAGQAFIAGRIALPNQTTGQRMNSVSVDGAPVFYPAQIDIETAWVEPSGRTGFPEPVSTSFFTVGGSAQTRGVRDTSITKGGGASIQTVAGQYIDFSINRVAMFRDSVVAISFWAKNAGGSSYAHVLTTLAGLETALVVPIVSTSWKQYTVTVPFTNDLDDSMKLRFGGNTGSANVQHIQVSGRRL